MTGHYNNFHQANYPRETSPCARHDQLDLFLSPIGSKSEQQVHTSYPPDLVSASSSDSSSVGEYQQNMKHAVVPYNMTQQQQQSSQQQLVPRPATTTTSPVPSTTMLATTTPLHKLITVPRSHNPFGADAVHPQKNKMKKQRKGKTAAGAVGGMVVGGRALGPAGVFLGAAAGAVATNKICKARERRAQRKYEQVSFQQAAEHSRVHAATFA